MWCLDVRWICIFLVLCGYVCQCSVVWIYSLSVFLACRRRADCRGCGEVLICLGTACDFFFF